jgi:hypothetical protein
MAARKRVSDSAFWSIYNAGVRDGRARAESAAATATAKKKPTGGKIHTITVATPKPKTAAGKKKPAATAVKPPNKRRKQTAVAR